MKQDDLRHMFKQVSKKVFVHQLLWHLLTLISHSTNISSHKDSENTEEEPADLEPADDGDILMEYFSV
jgi:hypothetical protein